MQYVIEAANQAKAQTPKQKTQKTSSDCNYGNNYYGDQICKQCK